MHSAGGMGGLFVTHLLESTGDSEENSSLGECLPHSVSGTFFLNVCQLGKSSWSLKL